ncbi:MAG: AAA family ATPase [Pirellulales bacterium]
MAKKKTPDESAAAALVAELENDRAPTTKGSGGAILRQPAEVLYAEEIAALIQEDKHDKPAGWQMSPRAVLTYICGGKAGKLDITPKYIGHRRLVEIAISTLVTDRALLLLGEPGTAKSWLSEHLTAAINGDSTKVVQGTAGTTEEQIRYTWNYAMLIAHGPSHSALIKSPVFRALESGSLARFEEITRCASEVQDAMISLLSEKRISVPELATEIAAAKGFSVIATANTRDRGVNDMSAALKRRFNIIVLPTPSELDTEIEIVGKRVRELSVSLELRAEVPHRDAIEKVVTIFRELRNGQTLDGKSKVKTPSGVLSTAEAISLLANSMALAGNFGTGQVAPDDIAAGLQGAIVKDEEKDHIVWQEYLTNVLKKRGAEWRPLYTACMEHLGSTNKVDEKDKEKANA